MAVDSYHPLPTHQAVSSTVQPRRKERTSSVHHPRRQIVRASRRKRAGDGRLLHLGARRDELCVEPAEGLWLLSGAAIAS
jgi:hypothetical protein